MTAKKLLVTASLIVVAMIYYYLYGDAFKKQPIEIIVTMRPRLGMARQGWNLDSNNEPTTDLAVFNLGREYRLTSVKVVALSDAETNKYPHPLWQMISETNSLPTSTFAYGRWIRGMHPAVKGARPEPLLPETSYRILVEAAHHTKGQHDFKTPGEENPQQ
jgi:hypothetical protein